MPSATSSETTVSPTHAWVAKRLWPLNPMSCCWQLRNRTSGQRLLRPYTLSPLGPPVRNSMLKRLLCLTALAVALPSTALAQDLDPVRTGLTPALSDTTLVADVEKVDGFVVRRSTGERFTGTIVDFFPSGAKRMRRSVADGQAEGFWIEWYESGVPRYMGSWAAGRGEGVWFYFHENGEVRVRTTVVDDVFTGPEESWYANGRKAYEGINLNNNQDGVWRYWNEDGTLDRTERYEDGELVEAPGQ